MKSKIFKVLTVLLALSVLTGCIPYYLMSQKDKEDPDDVVIVDDGSDGTDGTDGTDNTGDGDGGDDVVIDVQPTVPDDEPEVKIYSNGCYFVGVDGDVYYREFSKTGLSHWSHGSYFMNNSETSGNKIMVMEGGKPENISVLYDNDNGFGRLFYSDNYLYSQELVGQDYKVYRINLTSKDKETVCDGSILGVSPSSKTLITLNINGSFSVVQNGQVIDTQNISTDVIGYAYLYNDDENYYYLEATGSSYNTKVWQYNFENGTYNDLWHIDAEANGYSLGVDEVKFEDGLLSFNFYLVDDNDYAQTQYVVATKTAADPSLSSSVKVNNDSLCYESDSFYRNVPFHSVEVDYDIWHYLYNYDRRDQGIGIYQDVCCLEQVGSKTFMMIADCQESNLGSPSNNYLLNMHYMMIPAGGTKPEEFLSIPYDDGRVMVKAWLVGPEGGAPESIVYEAAEDFGDLGTYVDPHPYYANISDKVIYEYPESGNVNDEYTQDNLSYLTEDVKRWSKDYGFKMLPDVGLNEYGKLKEPESNYWNYYEVIFENGEVVLIRPLTYM